MKTAGEILSALFDERFVEKARGYSKFFDSWTDITAKNGIAAAADHSRIKELEKGVVLIEIDHPGWKQVLQTKQTKLLNDFRIRFPELDISGISLMLGSGKPREGEQKTEPEQGGEVAQKTEFEREPAAFVAAEKGPEISGVSEEPVVIGVDAIKDEELRERLIRIGRKIEEEEENK